MILENVKQEVNGKEETLDKLEINKSDIKELKLVHFEMKTEEKQNINAIPENKIPQNQENTQKAYDKNESFFDKLTSMTNPEARNESKNYNQKNKDTFNLTEQDKSNQNNKKYYHNNNNRGRGYNKYHNNKGRGGYNNNNYNKNYNNNYNNNFSSNYNPSGSYSNYNYRNNNNINSKAKSYKYTYDRNCDNYNNNYNIRKFNVRNNLPCLNYNYSTSSPQIKNDKETDPCCNKSRSFYNSYSFYGSQYC
jgi:hypothetical protein